MMSRPEADLSAETAAHEHDGHDHSTSVTVSNESRIRWVFGFTTLYAAVQAVGGWLSGSLALIADSGHMVSDSAALLLALIAYRVARRPADGTRTYGFHRVRVLAALANGASLLLLVAWITYEAVRRVNAPTEVLAGPMLIVATIGLGVNVAGAWMLWGGGGADRNMQGALLHVLGDLLGSLGAIIAAVGIMLTGWTVLDPILSVLVAVLVVRSAWSLVSESIRVLLQATPKGLDGVEAEAAIKAIPGVADVADFHAWTLSDDAIVATVHVAADPEVDPLSIPPLVADLLKAKYLVDHVTVQMDSADRLQSRRH